MVPMDINALLQKNLSVLQQLCDDEQLSRFVDSTLGIPNVFCGDGEIRLIVLGQDPTVKDPHSRSKIRTVLNLDSQRKGNLWNYLALICQQLGISLVENVYATNLVKNFFVQPPTQIKQMDVLKYALTYWLPILHSELALFPGIPVLTLGEPLLINIVINDAVPKVSHYWGFTPGWKRGEERPFSFLAADQNMLNRIVFPYPHQPSLQRGFYKDRLEQYSKSVRELI